MIVINGKTLNIDNINNVSIRQIGDKIIINGVDISEYTGDEKTINISITGDVNQLSVDSCNNLSVKGHVADVEITNGSISVEGDIVGKATTVNGSINANTIKGGAKTGNGSIKATNIYNS